MTQRERPAPTDRPLRDTNSQADSSARHVASAADRLAAALRAHGSDVSAKGMARCPAHDDSNASLSVGPRRDGAGVVLHCHAGCAPASVVAALGLTMSDLFDSPRAKSVWSTPRDYIYPDGRVVHRKPDKSFPQSGNTKGRSLFHADRIGDAETVHIVEGEKDVEAIELVGGAAVCSAMGAGKAHLADWEPLRGKHAVVVADRDEPGLKHARDVAAILSGVAASVRVVVAAVGKDAADHLAAGKTLGEFETVDVGQAEAEPDGATAVNLDAALATFSHWLHLADTAPVLATAAAVVANLAVGDPVWLLIVGPPSSGKTEILQSVAGLDYVASAATVSEAALLSGTSRRERASDATGGLLRQIGDFGILLAKDFTSVLSQNRDTARAAMAALREVYDGSWHRPVGTDGGKVLHWRGKCGFLGGVTPSYDRYGSIVNALGDRYLLLRMPDVDAAAQARAALSTTGREQQMRAELAAAMTGLIAGARTECLHAALPAPEQDRLVSLASFAARARTAVERDGYTGELLVSPQPEGPARLVKALRRMHGALGAVGADTQTRWAILERVALDCAPALRRPLMQALVDSSDPLRTAELGERVGMVTKTAARHLDDLALLGVAERRKHSGAANAPDLWAASEWLRELWPRKVRQKSTTERERRIKEEPNHPQDGPIPPTVGFCPTSEPQIPPSVGFCPTSGGDESESMFGDAPEGAEPDRRCGCGNQLASPEAQATGKCRPCRLRERVA